ncbi:MAG: hypothetical protein CVV39_06885 [Planctomycetes bacterium HGW-Planctomycetes-1]|nr:MAG: hypothetical protein CVV39_06885 [Planctomycetes bacterium HGW-Planctomycetes-1]
METASDTIKVLYKLNEISTKELYKQDYSKEEAFWFGFAVACLYIWDPNAKIEVRLSEILRLYLEPIPKPRKTSLMALKTPIMRVLGWLVTIYCEKVNPEMKVEDEARFVELLKEKYRQIRQSVLEIEDTYESSLKLGKIIHKEKLNIIKQALTADSVLSYAHATVPMPFRLVNDI